MGRSFPGGRNRPRGLSLIVDDDDKSKLVERVKQCNSALMKLNESSA